MTPSEAQLFREASEVYRGIRSEVDYLEASGGAKELPKALKQYIAGRLETNIGALYAVIWPQEGKQRIGPPPTIVWIRRPATKPVRGALVSTSACIDGSRISIRYGDGTTHRGAIQIQTFHYAFIDGALKAFDSSFKRVKKC